jgi:luciferase family oxidoreductase group 1
MMDVAYSVLDLVPVREGGTVADAFRESAELARHVEELGYTRYWLAEHHNMVGIASSATSVLIGHIARATRTIRVGSGGVMLPNHSPLIVAEQFGTLEVLFPGRIDLGLGRAPGTDPLTARALGRGVHPSAEDFPRQVEELRLYLGSDNGSGVRAFPGGGTNVPVWLLGSSTYSAQLAAKLGLPFAFAAHFAPGDLYTALAIYRDRFEPSARLDRPYAMVAVAAVAADTDDEAERLATTLSMRFLQLIRGEPLLLRPPVSPAEALPGERERLLVQSRFTEAIVGGPDTIGEKLAGLLDRTGASEVMFTTDVYDRAARLYSYSIVSAAMRRRGQFQGNLI